MTCTDITRLALEFSADTLTDAHLMAAVRAVAGIES